MGPPPLQKGNASRAWISPNKGDWGYGPLVISPAQTREALYLVNRPGHAPSHQDPAQWIDRSLDLVWGRFKTVWLRGDTDFSLTDHLDRWANRSHFVFGVAAHPNLVAMAAALPSSSKPLNWAGGFLIT